MAASISETLQRLKPGAVVPCPWPIDRSAPRQPAAVSKPIPGQIIVDRHGQAFFPDYRVGGRSGWFLHSGIRFGWAPAPELGGIIVHLLAGAAPGSGAPEDGFATFLTADVFEQMIAAMQAIRAATADDNFHAAAGGAPPPQASCGTEVPTERPANV